MECFDLANEGGLLPADLDGATAPPADTPNYLLNFGSNPLNLWKFHLDWTNPTSSTLLGRPRSRLRLSKLPPGTRRTWAMVSQPRTSGDAGHAQRPVMFRLAYRRFGDHESMAVNHAVEAGNSSGVRWYEVRDPGGAPKIFQQGTFAPDALPVDGQHRYGQGGKHADGLQCLQQADLAGDPFYGPRRDDPRTKWRLSSRRSGRGSKQPPERWGDYASMSIDPNDDCTFWFSTQYVSKTGKFNWST